MLLLGKILYTETKNFNIACQYLDIMDEYLLFEYLLFNIHFSPWRNMSNSLYTENRIQRTKFKILQNEPAGKFISFFLFLWMWKDKSCQPNFHTGVSQGSSWTFLKTDSGHVALLTEIFLKCYPERFFSSLKKTTVLYLVKKFETVVVIFTSGGKRVFLIAHRMIVIIITKQNL